jgi:hypothetical protein
MDTATVALWPTARAARRGSRSKRAAPRGISPELRAGAFSSAVHVSEMRERACGQPMMTGLVSRALLTSLAVTSTSAVVALAAPAISSALALPDSRVYEQVTPREKGGNVLHLYNSLAYPNASGDAVVTTGGFASSAQPSGQSWILRRRTTAGWVTSGSELGPGIPQGFLEYDQESTPFVWANGTSLSGISSDFSQVVFDTGLPLDGSDQNINQDLYTRDTSGGPFRWISGPPAPAVKTLGSFGSYCTILGEICAANSALFAGASSSLSTIVWTQIDPVVAPPATLPPGNTVDTHAKGAEVFQSEGGVVQLAGILPDGSVPACGAALGNVRSYEGFSPVHGAVSPDGSQVIFTSPDPDPRLGCPPPEVFMRVNGETTLAVSASQKNNGSGVNGTDPNGPKAKWYVGSTNDGSKITMVLFISSEALTNDATTGSADEGADLYSYDVATHHLIDLTVDGIAADPAGAGVIGFAGSSADGSVVYFAATGTLAAGATPGQPNLYVYDGKTGRTTFIASAGGMVSASAPGGQSNGVVVPNTPGSHGADENLTTQVTPDGGHMLFYDNQNLTAFDQHGSGELYLYDLGRASLTCVSCNPSGTPPVSGAAIPGVASLVPQVVALPSPRTISDNGSRVFFGSPDQLTPEAPIPATETGRQHEQLQSVYEWENGRISLIAPSEAGAGSATLVTSTPSGNDVYFSTAAQLVPSDADGTLDVYDARVNGGFAQVSGPLCTGSSCQGVPGQPPVFATPASVTFGGLGNLPPLALAAGTPRTAAQVRAAQLAKALRACRTKHDRRRRLACKSRALARYRASKPKRSAYVRGRVK